MEMKNNLMGLQTLNVAATAPSSSPSSAFVANSSRHSSRLSKGGVHGIEGGVGVDGLCLTTPQPPRGPADERRLPRRLATVEREEALGGGAAEARTRFKAGEELEGGEQEDQSGKILFSCPRLQLCEEEEDEVGGGGSVGEEGEDGDGESMSWI